MAERAFRNKIIWFTFLFSVLVIWVHSYNAVLFLGHTRTGLEVAKLEELFGQGISQIAVPGFFLISSYLFFRTYEPRLLLQKWNSRIKSVLVPYIVWNGLYYLGYVVGSRIPGIKDIIGKGTVELSVTEAVNAILHYSYNYVFWYLYQLILLILLAPLIYLAVKRLWVGAVFLAALLVGVYLGIRIPYLNLDALFYYSFGAFGAIHCKKAVEGRFDKRRMAMGALFIVLGVISLKTDLPGYSLGETASVTVVFRLLAPLGLWFLVPEGWLFPARDFMKHNFFLYAIHFALVRLINKTGAMALPPVPVLSFVLYLLMPAFAVAVSWFAGRLLRRFVPAVWGLLNGGR